MTESHTLKHPKDT